jgi:hypothetical protein
MTTIHQAAHISFDPANYDLAGVFDLMPDDKREDVARKEIVNKLIVQGYKFSNGSFGCGHCGKTIRYGALMLHPSTMEMLYIGQQCLTNRFENMTTAEFKKLRENARLNTERRNLKEQRAQFVLDNPVVQTLINYINENSTGEKAFGFYGSTFLYSLYEQFNRNCALTEKQMASIESSIKRDAEFKAQQKIREQEKIALVASGVKCPEGRVSIDGVVLSVKTVESDYGIQYKMLVQDNAGFKIWSTIPQSLNLVAGMQIRFSASITPSDTDPLFGFAKRPTKCTALVEGEWI